MTSEKSSRTFDFPVGKVVGFQGLDGRMKIRPSTNNPSLLLKIRDVRIDIGGEQSFQKVSKIKLEKKILLASLRGFSDRTSVEHLKGALVYTTREQLGELEEEEWWIDSIVGMEVYTTGGIKLGSIGKVIDSGTCLLEITMDDTSLGTRLVPFVKDLVPVVDTEKNRIEVEDIPGLLD